MSETYYDEHIAPKLLAIGKECEANGLSLIATCGYAPDTYGTTRVIQEGAGFALTMINAAVEARGNLDLFMMWMERSARKNGHSSVYLSMRGIPENPQTEGEQ